MNEPEISCISRRSCLFKNVSKSISVRLIQYKDGNKPYTCQYGRAYPKYQPNFYYYFCARVLVSWSLFTLRDVVAWWHNRLRTREQWPQGGGNGLEPLAGRVSRTDFCACNLTAQNNYVAASNLAFHEYILCVSREIYLGHPDTGASQRMIRDTVFEARFIRVSGNAHFLSTAIFSFEGCILYNTIENTIRLI